MRYSIPKPKHGTVAPYLLCADYKMLKNTGKVLYLHKIPPKEFKTIKGLREDNFIFCIMFKAYLKLIPSKRYFHLQALFRFI